MLSENLISILEKKKEFARVNMLASYTEGNIDLHEKYKAEISEIEEIIEKIRS